jgi:hypothetical protein
MKITDDHTPGPWYLMGGRYIVASNANGGHSIARMDDLECPASMRAANARLIAAAPDLAAENTRLRNILSAILEADERGQGVGYAEAMDAARAELDRGRGEH